MQEGFLFSNDSSAVKLFLSRILYYLQGHLRLYRTPRAPLDHGCAPSARRRQRTVVGGIRTPSNVPSPLPRLPRAAAALFRPSMRYLAAPYTRRCAVVAGWGRQRHISVCKVQQAWHETRLGRREGRPCSQFPLELCSSTLKVLPLKVARPCEHFKNSIFCVDFIAMWRRSTESRVWRIGRPVAGEKNICAGLRRARAL